MAKNLDNSKNIINYLKFQRINFNRELQKFWKNIHTIHNHLEI